MIGFLRHILATNKKRESAYICRLFLDLCPSSNVSLTGCSSAEPVSVSIRLDKVIYFLYPKTNLFKNYNRIKYSINFVNKF